MIAQQRGILEETSPGCRNVLEAGFNQYFRKLLAVPIIEHSVEVPPLAAQTAYPCALSTRPTLDGDMSSKIVLSSIRFRV